jgi:hypothetical protein
VLNGRVVVRCQVLVNMSLLEQAESTYIKASQVWAMAWF